jgi:outer membrane protein assembly factor BamB
MNEVYTVMLTHKRILTCVVYGTEDPEPSIVASTLNSEKLWSHPIHEYIETLAISDDGQSIIVTSLAHVYKFTPNGNLVWDTNVGTNNDYIDLTPSADFIAVGSNTLVSTFIVLDGD